MLTAKELYEAFPDDVSLAKKRIRKLKILINDWKDVVKSIMEFDLSDENIIKYNTKLFWILACKKYIKHDPAVKELKILNEYVKLISLSKNKEIKESGLNNNDIEFAKKVPILSLFDPEKPRKSQNSTTCCCPLHKEKTPSFVVYHNSNRFKCFGCGEHGDSIAFIMKYKDIPFIDSVKELL